MRQLKARWLTLLHSYVHYWMADAVCLALGVIPIAVVILDDRNTPWSVQQGGLPIMQPACCDADAKTILKMR